MHQSLLNVLFARQNQYEEIPENIEIADWANELIGVLFPEKGGIAFENPEAIDQKLTALEHRLSFLLIATKACASCNNPKIANDFFEKLPAIYELLNTDISAIVDGDPAAKSSFEVIRAYPGFFAMSFYRIAHALHMLGVPLIPRILTEYAHTQTGIDIHPGAVIGSHFCIDHGTGVVIGETSIIGNHVKLYQGVTLGALSVEKSMANTKRHPTVEDNVVIYSGATILGGATIIGDNSIIGGNVWLTKSVPARSMVYHKPETEVVERRK